MPVIHNNNGKKRTKVQARTANLGTLMKLKTQQDSEAFSDMEAKLALSQSVGGSLRGKVLGD